MSNNSPLHLSGEIAKINYNFFNLMFGLIYIIELNITKCTINLY